MTPRKPVLAGLVHDGTAERVARVAAAEAARQGVRLEVLHVTAGWALDPDRAAEDRLFGIVLRAVRDHRTLRFSFQSVAGDPSDRLVERSARASLLVPCADSGPGREVAAECQRRARCPVLVVDRVDDEALATS